MDGYPRQVWRDAAGRDVIESYTITSMAHGTPLATGDGENAYGAAGPFLLDVGISSTYHIAKFWGLTAAAAEASVREAALVAPNGEIAMPRSQPDTRRPANGPRRSEEIPESQFQARSLPVDIQAIIDKALKAAGLKT